MKIGFAGNLKKLRKLNHLSQEVLSGKLGLSKGVVTLYENAKNYPNMDTLIKLCEIFDVSLDGLILDSSSYSAKQDTSQAEKEFTKLYANKPMAGLLERLVSTETRKEIGYLTKTVAMQEREINTMRSYTSRLEKELEKCEESLQKEKRNVPQTG